MAGDNKNKSKIPWIPSLIGGLVGAVLIGGVGVAISNFNAPSDSSEEVSSLVKEQVTSQVSEQMAAQANSSSRQEATVDVSSDVSETVTGVQDAVVSVANLENTEGVYDLFGFASPEASESTTEEQAEYETASEGSGVIYKVEGDTAYIVTNNHVIAGSDAVEILLSDGTQVPVEVVGSDVWTDLAVLSMPAEAAPQVAEFGDSSALKVGEPVIAIGSPLGSEFASTVTQGIISGLNRAVPTDLNGDGTPDWQVTAIQTDAAINPGNSGGALVNAAGQVIGINSMKISSDSVEGMGFAIPSNDVQKIITDLEEYGRVIRPEFGITMASLMNIPLEQQEMVLNLPEEVESGVVVVDVTPSSPAANAGIVSNDVITKFNGTEVTNIVDLRQALFDAEADGTVEVELYRNGELQTVEVTLQPQDTEVS